MQRDIICGCKAISRHNCNWRCIDHLAFAIQQQTATGDWKMHHNYTPARCHVNASSQQHLEPQLPIGTWFFRNICYFATNFCRLGSGEGWRGVVGGIGKYHQSGITYSVLHYFRVWQQTLNRACHTNCNTPLFQL